MGMKANTISPERIVLSIGGGGMFTCALLAALLTAGVGDAPHYADYRLLFGWPLTWPEQLLPRALHAAGDGAFLTIFLWDVLFYSIPINVILQLKAARSRLP